MRQVGPVQIVELKTKSGTSWFVEVREAQIQGASTHARDVQHLPEGSEAVGAREKLASAVDGLSELIDAAADVVGRALERHSPTEITVELNVGFTGSVNPIPFLVGGEAEAALKITATWKAPTSA